MVDTESDQFVVRVIALACASMAMSGRQHSSMDEVLKVAKEFEDYLTDEETL